MPIYFETDNGPIFPDDYGTAERHGLLHDVEGASRPDRVAVGLSRLIACLFVVLAVLGCYLQSKGVA
jgi:hypothetical protein